MANGSSLDRPEAETFTEFHKNGGCLVEGRVDSADHDNDKAKQKSLFFQLFSAYLKENCSRGNVRPVPVMLGEGQLLDLYQLFALVKEKGGYDAVSRKGLWNSVIVELGLDLRILASVKLVFDKYLNDFEGWLRKSFEEKSLKNGNDGLNSLPIDLEKEFQNLFCSNLKDKDDDFVPLESSNIIKHIDLVNQKSDGYLLDTKNQNNKCDGVQNVNSYGNGGDDEKLGTGVKDVMTASCVETEKEFNSRKRNRESPVAQPLTEPSKGKEYKGDQDIFVQMLRARDVLSVRKHAEPNRGSSSKKVKMNPAKYEDLRRSKRLSVAKLHGMESEKIPMEKTTSKPDVMIKKKKSTSKAAVTKKKISTAKAAVTEEKKYDPFSDDSRDVSVGPLFQVEVPQWTGIVYGSDSKSLGTQVWPVKDDSRPTTETDLIGRGRQGKCSCNVQGSVDCVRLHIAANRMKLKFELGSAFYHWGFDKMGEEVSLQWTGDEEKRFKDIMSLKIPSQNKSFWNNPSSYFQKRTRKDMVSYYFNVYLIQLRSYQNRVTSETVDSDDDEIEFESFGDGFGRKAIKRPSIEFKECSENK
ncbi:AT-rich interactive domain-containing protein 2 [Medicago truncatula]|uniref:AT-rich interactive domain-containing protein 2 n=1 Tax=Medicago truncatula TaxID=3880 RepID=UPI0019689D69|nr:AT-rich interactive domain-containing protein 2 [Medicago truncatula]XP_039684320.1 AT-rich interactive domain-containing protein 2 [Medicago truncatula]XP_039684321.1 AT-rich interactive domain-containing protein 2 [Medicago truncatula]XP_039684323.1 AT-rich interactive domain-containing protein 2 [Medicago truncatula]